MKDYGHPDPSSTVPQYQKYFVQTSTFHLLSKIIHAIILQYNTNANDSQASASFW